MLQRMGDLTRTQLLLVALALQLAVPVVLLDPWNVAGTLLLLVPALLGQRWAVTVSAWLACLVAAAGALALLSALTSSAEVAGTGHLPFWLCTAASAVVLLRVRRGDQEPAPLPA